MRFTFCLFLVFIGLVLSCNSEVKEKSVDSFTVIVDSLDVVDTPRLNPYELFKVKDTISYQMQMTRLKDQKSQVRKAYQSGRIGLDSVERFFIQNLVFKVFPYWYGTPWTFEGHTNVPNQGEIACGYFISTTLKHFGMNVNRYKMAQKAALTGLHMVCKPSEVKRFSNDSFGCAAAKISHEVKPGLYMAGFDYHVGYLLVDSVGLHFIHSSNFDPVQVTVEDAHLSEAFNASNNVYLGNLGNPFFLVKWLQETEFQVPR